jgi:hypothetical protein
MVVPWGLIPQAVTGCSPPVVVVVVVVVVAKLPHNTTSHQSWNQYYSLDPSSFDSTVPF